MLFEISTAFRFLKPNPREFARSLICLLALGVITTICWLVIVFYSITEGLERRWVDQLVRLTGSVRLFPTSDYFNGYTFLVDSYSAKSDYQHQTLGEQLRRYNTSENGDVWDEQSDPPRPPSLSQLRKQQPWQAMEWLSERLDHAYTEVVAAPVLCQVELDHWNRGPSHPEPQHVEWKSEQHASLLALEPWQREAQALLCPLEKADARALWSSLEFLPSFVAKKILHNLKPQILSFTWSGSLLPILPPPPSQAIAGLATSSQAIALQDSPSIEQSLQPLALFHWSVPSHEMTGHVMTGHVMTGHVMTGHVMTSHQMLADEPITIYAANQHELDHLQESPQLWLDYLQRSATPSHRHFLYTPGWNLEQVDLNQLQHRDGELWISANIRSSGHASGSTSCPIQIPLRSIEPREIARQIEEGSTPPLLSFENPGSFENPAASNCEVPSEKTGGEANSWVGLLAPKSLRDAGLHAGARLCMKREMIGPLGAFEMQARGVIVGFYDTGIFPLGARYLIAPYNCVYGFYEPMEMNPQSNFLQMWPSDPSAFANSLRADIDEHQLADQFQVQTYEEFPFSRDLLIQMRSDRLLLSLIAMIILVVACSSIASMLVLLVNERRREIALFKALGMPSWRIILCFGLTGTLMGLLSAALAISLAYFTLLNIDSLMAALSYLHGQPLLSPQFYGQHLPRHMSPYAVKLVAYGSIGLSTLAGSLACLHGARLSPSQIMRSL